MRVEESHFGLGLSYETFWYPRPGPQDDHPIIDLQEDEAKLVSKTKSKSPSVLKGAKESQLEANLMEQASKIQELLLAFKMKQEEMRSLVRLSEQFEHFREHIVNSIQKLRVRRGEEAEYEEIEGFKEEVQWEDSIFHDSPSDQR